MPALNVDLQINDIYIPHLENTARTQIFYGGAGSGKSVFLAQRAVIDVLQGGRNYLICRAAGKYSRKSTWAECLNVIEGAELGHLFKVRIVEQVIECQNGYQLLFSGLDDTQKLKSMRPAKGAISDIWVEEATETGRQDIKELYKRQRGGDPAIPKRLTMSFNPITQTHWIYDEYFKGVGWAEEQTAHREAGISILKTWYIHNRFLTPEDVADLEGERDPYYHQVYTLGNWGVLGNVIFRNWRVRDLAPLRAQFTNRRNGLDFGFSSDPAALVVSHYDRKRKIIYIFDELYEYGLTNDLLAGLVKEKIGSDYVVCDSSEPKSIAELNAHGVRADGAVKGKDSVLHGIQWLQQHTLIIDKACIHTRNELTQFKWKEDKHGKAMRLPLDKNNHLIDALRYAYEADMEAYWLAM